MNFDIEILESTKKLKFKEDVISITSFGKSREQKIKLLILRDLINLDWQIKVCINKIEVNPPEFYNKNTIKQAMSLKRNELIKKNQGWIDKHINLARQNLANGLDVLTSKVDPVIEVCTTKKQHNLFRIFRYYWSSPYSDYVGRRIKLLIRDYGLPNKPIIGIAALGSPIIHIPERDDFIGWDRNTRTNNLIYTMDAYVIGALPPYNELLGGKLISLLLASNEVRKIYKEKYRNKVTIIEGRSANSLVGLFTTSLYGKSSQYNRLKYHNYQIYRPIGYTKGFGTLHLSDETIKEMINYLKSKNIEINHRFGDGPSWVMRVIRTTGDLLGFDSDFLLKHSFKRGIYFVQLAENSLEVLNGKRIKPKYFDYPKDELVMYWKKRWFEKRKKDQNVISRILNFDPQDFNL